MFNMSGTELIIILLLALVLIGPEDLPRVAQTIRKTSKQIQLLNDSSDPIERAVLFTLIALAVLVFALAVAAARSS